MISDLLMVTGVSLTCVAMFFWFTGRSTRGDGIAVISNLFCAMSNFMDGRLGWGAFNATTAALLAWAWWNKGGGKRTKKAARELGAKSRARVEDLVRQMTPSPIPNLGGAS